MLSQIGMEPDVVPEFSVVLTSNLHYERHIEGWGLRIKEAAKEMFLDDIINDIPRLAERPEIQESAP